MNYWRDNCSSGSYESEPRTRAESDAAYRPRGSSASRGVRSTKTRSADVTDYYQDVAEEDVQRRRSPRTQDSARWAAFSLIAASLPQPWGEWRGYLEKRNWWLGYSECRFYSVECCFFLSRSC